jgi:hypothetical protein
MRIKPWLAPALREARDDLQSTQHRAARWLADESIQPAALGQCNIGAPVWSTLPRTLLLLIEPRKLCAAGARWQGRNPVRPAPRHAELAVNLAGAMAVFLVATHQAQPLPPKIG